MDNIVQRPSFAVTKRHDCKDGSVIFIITRDFEHYSAYIDDGVEPRILVQNASRSAAQLAYLTELIKEDNHAD